eukprot:1427038-Rhodomonas_salina.2
MALVTTRHLKPSLIARSSRGWVEGHLSAERIRASTLITELSVTTSCPEHQPDVRTQNQKDVPRVRKRFQRESR